MIKYKSSHISPVEIEDIIRKHPGVAEVAVFGKPELLTQELITAVVIKKKDFQNLTEEEIIELVNSTVQEDYKRLRGGVIFVDKLPTNSIGKVTRMDLSKLACKY